VIDSTLSKRSPTDAAARVPDYERIARPPPPKNIGGGGYAQNYNIKIEIDFLIIAD
jgi:hypothetical protein